MMENENAKTEQNLKSVLEMIGQKRKKHGERYERFLWTVAQLLRVEFPGTFAGMSEAQLRQLIAFVDTVGEDTQAMMKRLKDACAGCGWCCSQTGNIVVSAEDAERISRQLKQKRDDLFVMRNNEWTIKNAHPCQWWNQKTGRCQIYSIRPVTCRIWPSSLPNEQGIRCLQPVAECAYAVRVTAVKVMESLEAQKKAAGS
ncbi:YkgJ family cysteine cluster protein [Dehalogenimonas etheniformans]|uniref:YkgJ family cysteine cluster protein n=1 Tax=Dehalogenimonas etheniformans TaxID=1536648 RepID=A0A2P5P4Y0_9CHLR|nr:YkgJ family cysteine cluster protein [Dehalogenimonas etheniformans]PPD57345.1 YkgJ family cysteine cluster protein [Dehalogenimonas etheniformans]QNT75195.1 YkgJ family cysteine cluster protein [Dehalogenimonas etheniformans]